MSEKSAINERKIASDKNFCRNSVSECQTTVNKNYHI